jgi:hypothetical protein
MMRNDSPFQGHGFREEKYNIEEKRRNKAALFRASVHISFLQAVPADGRY